MTIKRVGGTVSISIFYMQLILPSQTTNIIPVLYFIVPSRCSRTLLKRYPYGKSERFWRYRLLNSLKRYSQPYDAAYKHDVENQLGHDNSGFDTATHEKAPKDPNIVD